ncbi:DUF2794 domain-containing protein [Luteithermobacter gelatinilyticus]|uniref:DUF2794 domain-containing protein n=1 Tax=Luteithermobacter gelatinilyticus TaxID=2582913 RepID=UPI001106E421|nr:DUF2794 domain-containing protein [Luteithermobacter gelatinilyticus]
MVDETSTIIPFHHGGGAAAASSPQQIFFTREELQHILNIYGRMVSAGHWKDYAMQAGKEQACFAIFQRASERPLYRITKTPKLERKQGAYALISAQGQILKRGHDLRQLLKYFDRKFFKLIP